jgi:hypothetical protein
MKQKYHLTFAKDEQGNDIKFRFVLSMGKRIREVEKELLPVLASIPGLDAFSPMGFYTLDIAICRAFDPEEVLTTLTGHLDKILSEIVLS